MLKGTLRRLTGLIAAAALFVGLGLQVFAAVTRSLHGPSYERNIALCLDTGLRGSFYFMQPAARLLRSGQKARRDSADGVRSSRGLG